MSILPLLLFILPLGLDTLGVSMSLGVKSRGSNTATRRVIKGLQLPAWFITSNLFSLAETLMPLLGLAIGYATSLAMSNIMHVVGPMILISVGLWELLEEGQEYFKKHKKSGLNTSQKRTSQEQFQWRRQLLLALSISLDELAIGFSLGTIAVSHESVVTLYPIMICVLIGIQGFLMALIGITLGRMLRSRMRNLKEWTEFLSAFLLIGLGIWLLVT